MTKKQLANRGKDKLKTGRPEERMQKIAHTRYHKRKEKRTEKIKEKHYLEI